MVRHILALDQAILLTVRCWQMPWITSMMRAATQIGDASSWVFVSLVLLAAGGPARHCGWLVGVSSALATVFSQALKRICRRPRPSTGIGGFTALADNPDVFSFPSGHASAAFAVAIALAGQGALGRFQLGAALAIGFSRIYLGAHYPLDVAMGAMLGVVAGAIARMIL